MIVISKCIVTTSWDDGFQTDGKLASLLLDYGLKGTFYIARNWVEKSNDSCLIEELDRDFEIGAHTISHPDLTTIPLGERQSEIQGSKEWLEEMLGHKIRMFAYPYGKYDRRTVALVEKAGFMGARTLDFAINPPKDSFLLGVGHQASNGSPLLRLRASFKIHFSLKSLVDWAANAKSLFDHALENGGMWHLWGHSWEIDKNCEWSKLEEVFEYVSKKTRVLYLPNGEIMRFSAR